MNSGQSLLTPRVVWLVILAVILLGCVTVYDTRSSSFVQASPNPSFRPPLTNAEVLYNWLPSGVYAYTIARVDDYLRANNLAASYLTVRGQVTPLDQPTYAFSVEVEPEALSLIIGVSVSNTSTVLSTAVTINGQAQTPLIPSAQSAAGATSYSGFDALVNAGLTAIQSNELEQAIYSFAPSAGTVSINPTSINNGDIPAGGTTQTYTFSVTIDNKKYNATLSAIGLLEVRLQLTDPASSRQVFDSGVLSQTS
jgi:hypothetical protein